MMNLRSVIPAFVVMFSAVPFAAAASSQWFETPGGRVRIVTETPGAGATTLKGALDIRLQPGWKTYWRDPGASGVPPQVDVSKSKGISGVEIGFPPPHRFEEEYGSWAGYKSDVALALSFTVESGERPTTLDADVFIGVCEEICIPVQTRLVIDLESAQDDPEAERIVTQAFAAVPGPARSDFGVSGSAAGAGGNIQVTAHFPADTGQPDLFVENVDGWYFGTPVVASMDGGTALFSIPVLEMPANSPGNASIPYTLVSSNGAVSGTFGVTSQSH